MVDHFQRRTTGSLCVGISNKQVEEIIRAYIESCTNARFIFIGTQQEMLDKMFILPPRPFYYSVSLYLLHPLSLLTYKKFCISKFEAAGKHLEDDVIVKVYNMFDAVTYDMQQVLNQLYAQTEEGSTCEISMVDIAVTEVVNRFSKGFDSILSGLTENRRRLLLAIAREGKVERRLSPRFLKRYNLTIDKTYASIKRLLDLHLVTIYGDYYSLANRLFSLWLLTNYTTS